MTAATAEPSYRQGDLTLLPTPPLRLEVWGSPSNWEPLLPYVESLGYAFWSEDAYPRWTPAAMFTKIADPGPEDEKQRYWITYLDGHQGHELEIYKRLKMGDPAVARDPRNPLVEVHEVCDATPAGHTPERQCCLLVTENASVDSLQSRYIFGNFFPSLFVAALGDILQGLAFIHEHGVIGGVGRYYALKDKQTENNVYHRFMLTSFGKESFIVDNPLAFTAGHVAKSSYRLLPEFTRPGSGDQRVPVEHSTPLDPFKLDVHILASSFLLHLKGVPEIDDLLRSFLERLHATDPVQRPTAKEALAMYEQEKDHWIAEAVRLDTLSATYPQYCELRRWRNGESSDEKDVACSQGGEPQCSRPVSEPSYRQGDLTLLPTPPLRLEGWSNPNWRPLLPYIESLGYSYWWDDAYPRWTPAAMFTKIADLGPEDEKTRYWITYLDVRRGRELEIYKRLKMGDPAIARDPRNPLVEVHEVSDATPVGHTPERQCCLLVTENASLDSTQFRYLYANFFPSLIVAALGDILQGLAFIHEHGVIGGAGRYYALKDKQTENHIAHRFMLHAFGDEGFIIDDPSAVTAGHFDNSYIHLPELYDTSDQKVDDHKSIDPFKLDVCNLGRNFLTLLKDMPEMDVLLRTFLERLKATDPAQRPTAKEALAMFEQEKEHWVAEAMRLDTEDVSYPRYCDLPRWRNAEYSDEEEGEGEALRDEGAVDHS